MPTAREELLPTIARARPMAHFWVREEALPVWEKQYRTTWMTSNFESVMRKGYRLWPTPFGEKKNEGIS